MANSHKKTKKTNKTNKTNKTGGEPALDPGAFKVNTVRRGVNGYWWIVTDARWAGQAQTEGVLWMPLGNHSTKNGKTRRVKHKQTNEEKAAEKEEKDALETMGTIRVSFHITESCEKSGKLPKVCDLENEGKRLFKPFQKTGWGMGWFDYAISPKDTYKYAHVYGGPLSQMEEVVTILKKHYAKRISEGAISEIHITAEAKKEGKRHSWYSG